MTFRLSISCVLLMCTPSFAIQETGTTSLDHKSPETRQAAVEAGLLAQTWVNGHAFGMLERMRILDVPGVSVAVIHNGKLDWAAGYGVRDETSGLPVTTVTLFQGASISKSVSALATLRLAQEGRLDLDAPIQDILVSFQLPDADFDGEVTPRHILNHTGGLNVHGFAGYPFGKPIPTAADLLAGRGNSESLRRIEPTDTQYRYSGGGSTMLQVALTDLTGKNFQTIARENVLTPLGMTRSTYEQPLPIDSWPNHSAAHDHGGRRITGGFHVYPEQFPAGLWTTPSDLARFVLEMQRVAGGHNGQVLESKWGKEMLTPVFGRAALGLFIQKFDGERWFQHSGSNKGFKCDFRASFSGGNGVIVMTNGEMGFEICQDVIRAVAKVYKWPGMVPDPLKEITVSPDQLKQYAGDYAFRPDEVAFITRKGDRLMVQQLPYPQMPLAHIEDHRFQIIGTEFYIDFIGTSQGETQSLSMSFAPDQIAKRMTTEESWPVQDLLLGNAKIAIDQYRKAHEIDPKNPMIECDRLIQLAMSLSKFKQPEVALALSKSITEMYPADADAWDMLGQANSNLGNNIAAINAYKKCLQLIPDDPTLDQSNRDRLQAHTTARLRWFDE